LDDPAAPDHEVQRNLADLRRSNRWFGGCASLRFALDGLLGPGTGDTVTLLDIGTGAGDLPANARSWGVRAGWHVVPVALERIPAAAKVAAATGLPTFLGCASELPLRSGTVDVVLLSQVLNHFDRRAAEEVVRACVAVARVGVVVLDLRRSAMAGAAFRMGARLMGFSPITVQDGLTSLRRGFSATELEAVLAAAGVDVTVRRRPGSRLVAYWRKDHRC